MKTHLASRFWPSLCGKVGPSTTDRDACTCGLCLRIIERRNGSAAFRAPVGKALKQHAWRKNEYANTTISDCGTCGTCGSEAAFSPAALAAPAER